MADEKDDTSNAAETDQAGDDQAEATQDSAEAASEAVIEAEQSAGEAEAAPDASAESKEADSKAEPAAAKPVGLPKKQLIIIIASIAITIIISVGIGAGVAGAVAMMMVDKPAATQSGSDQDSKSAHKQAEHAEAGADLHEDEAHEDSASDAEHDDAEADSEEEGVYQPPKKPTGQALYYIIKPSFVINLTTDQARKEQEAKAAKKKAKKEGGKAEDAEHGEGGDGGGHGGASTGDDTQHYLQVSVTLMTRDIDVIEALTQHQSIIKDDLVTLFSAKTFAEINTAEGRQALQKETLAVVRRSLGYGPNDQGGIEAVYFTSYIMQ